MRRAKQRYEMTDALYESGARGTRCRRGDGKAGGNAIWNFVDDTRSAFSVSDAGVVDSEMTVESNNQHVIHAVLRAC